MKKSLVLSFCLASVFSFSEAASSQSKSTKKNTSKQPPAKSAPAESHPDPRSKSSVEASTSPTPHKRNSRPDNSAASPGAGEAQHLSQNTYLYEFERPGFAYGKVTIEHDDTGVGQISFLKDGFDEVMTDPIRLSRPTLAKIDDTLAAMDFLGSTENYQYEKDYSHLGNVTITVKRDSRERTVKYNWTTHKQAKALMDEYRRIANEYTWRFEMVLAQENQPLNTPALMETLDAYVKRGEISDPAQMLPLLERLSTDERLPLMARNRALKVIKQIEKAKH